MKIDKEATLIPEEPTQYEATLALLRERRESRAPTPEDVLTEMVNHELERRRFGLFVERKGVMIHDLLTPDQIAKFDKATVARVSYNAGLTYYVCPAGANHPDERLRFDGVWFDRDKVLPELHGHRISQVEYVPCHSCITGHADEHYDCIKHEYSEYS